MQHVISITRPTEHHWPQMLDVLKTANFHHIGSVEMSEFPLDSCFISLVDDHVRGVGGYKVLNPLEAKTTLLAVDPDWVHLRLGTKLQVARLDYLRASGIRSVTTNTDDPRVARWLERKFGFQKTGVTVPKEADFGNPDVGEWTNLKVTWKPS